MGTKEEGSGSVGIKKKGPRGPGSRPCTVSSHTGTAVRSGVVLTSHKDLSSRYRFTLSTEGRGTWTYGKSSLQRPSSSLLLYYPTLVSQTIHRHNSRTHTNVYIRPRFSVVHFN